MITWTEILTRLLAAALFGAMVGLERERKRWSSAGMRTHMMVCLGACLIMLVSAFGFSEALTQDKVILDPSRVAAQVITGIGFIGAGTIVLLKQTQIKGLTTAAGLWTVAAIGLATGGGMYFAAGITTVVALVILWALQPLEKKLLHHFAQKHLQFTAAHTARMSEIIAGLILNSHVAGLKSKMSDTKNETSVHVVFNKTDEEELGAIIRELQSMAEVKEISWGDSDQSEGSRK